MEWNLSTDVVVIGAGAAGLAAAVSARDHGAAVVVVEENYDIGGHAMLSGGRVHLGGGNALQKKFNIKDSPEQVFADWVNYGRGDSRYNDRDLVRAFADECVPTFQFLLDNGVTFIEKPIVTPDASTVPRVFVTHEWHVPSEVIAPRRNRNGSGLVRRLAESARKKGAQILLKHEMTQIVREHGKGGKVQGVVVQADGRDIAIEAKKGIVIATGGHTGNVNFRRMFDPRLTEEYQQAGLPYSFQGADGELAAMDIGASLWATGTPDQRGRPRHHQDAPHRMPVGLSQPLFRDRQPDLPSVQGDRPDDDGLAGGDPGQSGRPAFLERARQLLRLHRRGAWATTATRPSSTAAVRSGRSSTPMPWRGRSGSRSRRMSTRTAISPAPTRSSSWPARIRNPYQKQPISGGVLQETVNRYNSFVTSGVDADFGKPVPLHKIEKPPFYAAWSTPILHDSLTGLRTDPHAQVIDIRGEVIPGSIAPANPRAALPSTGSGAAWCSAASPAGMRRSGIHKEAIVTEIMHSNPISLAVWDVPMPVVAGEMFSIKAGAKSAIRPFAGRPPCRGLRRHRSRGGIRHAW